METLSVKFLISVKKIGAFELVYTKMINEWFVYRKADNGLLLKVKETRARQFMSEKRAKQILKQYLQTLKTNK